VSSYGGRVTSTAETPRTRRRLLSTAEGISAAAFTPADWVLLLVASLIWGSSFLLIAEGLESLAPGTVTWLRVIFGWLALSILPGARRSAIDPADRSRIALIGVLWMALPMTLFPIAEQWISSSITGMLNGSLPLFAATVAAIMLRRLPGPKQRLGILVGFAGVVAVSLPSLQAGSDTALGAGLVVLALASYGVATNVVVPMQQRYGSLPIIWRAQLVAIALTAPYGIVGLSDSSFEWKPVAAVVALGAFGTGFAFLAAGTLIGRVGATRASVLAYIIPVISLVLGVVLRDEHVEALAIAGLGLVLAGAWLTSRAGR
jgi:drug/metabolite transporter (DMT)-like permease